MLRSVKGSLMTTLQVFHIRQRSLLLVIMRRTFQSKVVSAQHRCLHLAVSTSRMPPSLSMEFTSMAVLGTYWGITHSQGPFPFRTPVCRHTGGIFLKTRMCWWHTVQRMVWLILAPTSTCSTWPDTVISVTTITKSSHTLDVLHCSMKFYIVSGMSVNVLWFHHTSAKEVMFTDVCLFVLLLMYMVDVPSPSSALSLISL